MSMLKDVRGGMGALAIGVLVWGCGERPTFEPGEECELNSECAAPLVCRLGRCRVECRAMRDCPAGLQCVRDEGGFGACQLPDETDCTLSSDCPEHLVCRFRRCTNACESDVDCPPGARCEADDHGELGCRDQAGRECSLNTHCDDLLICAPDGYCREPCRTDRDCRDGTVCDTALSPTACVWPRDRTDAGPGGTRDGGSDAGRPIDGGSGDAGLDGSVEDAGAVDGGAMVMGTPPPPPRLAAGEGHTCASPAGVGHHCWGRNDLGQVGRAGMLAEPSPVPSGLSGVTVTGAGARHSCAIHGGGTVSCWGDNSNGQLGIGFVGGRQTAPVEVTTLPGAATDLALGNDHTCVIDTGQLYCFGDNASGQLGTGSRRPEAAPVAVSLPRSPLMVATYGSHTCTLLDDFRVFCFGENQNGQSGDGTTTGDRLLPGPVAGLGPSIHVATGATHSCAIEADGAVKCWGSDRLGQRGDGGAGDPDTGAAVSIPPLMGPALQLALGSAHSCAVTATALHCWGDNGFGQLGLDPSITFTAYSPVRIASVGRADEVACGTSHTCVRDGTRVRCFGDNGWGQLGDGTSGGGGHTPRTVTWP